MSTLIQQVIVALFFIGFAIFFGKKAISKTPTILSENNLEDIRDEGEAQQFEKLAHLSLILGAIFVYLIK
jgi:hypothetical protein